MERCIAWYGTGWLGGVGFLLHLGLGIGIMGIWEFGNLGFRKLASTALGLGQDHHRVPLVFRAFFSGVGMGRIHIRYHGSLGQGL